MTTQIKYFIEPADIVSVRLECLHCGASVTLAISREFNLERLGECPMCRRAWLVTPDSSITHTVKECVSAIDKIVTTLRDWKGTLKTLHHPGFSLSLEIKKGCDDKE